jgi:Leucine-rich repeat (LRR) protein
LPTLECKCITPAHQQLTFCTRACTLSLTHSLSHSLSHSLTHTRSCLGTGQLTSLKKLRLAQNRFVHLSVDLAQLLSLEELNIGQNPLVDVPPVLCTLPVLRVMQVPRARDEHMGLHARSLTHAPLHAYTCLSVCLTVRPEY